LVVAARPAIPHGERRARGGEDPEDTLPAHPLCDECRAPIYYERGSWWHHDENDDRLHAAAPQIRRLNGWRDEE
jgi:hypothetical protein